MEDKQIVNSIRESLKTDLTKESITVNNFEEMINKTEGPLPLLLSKKSTLYKKYGKDKVKEWSQSGRLMWIP